MSAAEGTAGDRRADLAPGSESASASQQQQHAPTFLSLVIHSTCKHDIDQAKATNMWASTRGGGDKLDAYFRRGGDNTVIFLYFTEHATGRFSGVARMVRLPSFRGDLSKAQRPVWKEDIWDSRLCELEWLFADDPGVDYYPEVHSVYIRDINVIPDSEAKAMLAKILRLGEYTARDYADRPLLNQARVYAGFVDGTG